jgi:hemerythrin
MPLIDWNDRYSVGVRSLDAQHRQLIDILNQLHQAMSTANSQQVLPALMRQLSQYATAHLQAEERMLRAQGYPGFAQHKAQHDSYIAKVKDFQEQLSKNPTGASIGLMGFLREWWTSHILTVDKQYSQFLKTKGVS